MDIKYLVSISTSIRILNKFVNTYYCRSIKNMGEQIIETFQLRRILSTNIKARRKKLGISQEKLAEMADLSLQMVNSIEGHRVWVSDKTLISLSEALGIDVFQLFTPATENQKQERRPLPSHWLLKLRQDMKEDINANVDMHFERLFSITLRD